MFVYTWTARFRHDMIIEDLSGGIQKLVDGGIANGVVHIGAGLAGSDDVFVAKHCELLRRFGLLNAEFLTDFGNCPLAVTKTVKNRNSKRMSKSLEKFRLELSQLRLHGLRYSHPVICTSAHTMDNRTSEKQVELTVRMNPASQSRNPTS